jgi:two-component system chemotaxis sensor kinase CheA
MNYPNALQLAEKIALELVFAQPGRDEGLLPVNSLLTDLSELLSAEPAVPEPIQRGIAVARECVDDALVAGGFSANLLERLSSLVSWLPVALRAWEQNGSIPDVPRSSGAAATASQPAFSAPTAAAAVSDEIVLNLKENEDLLREFIEESKEHLQEIELGVLALEENPEDEESLNAIFRAFHTLKGGSGFLNLGPINRLAHELESLLELARQHQLRLEGNSINLVLGGADTLKAMVEAVQRQVTGTDPHQPIPTEVQPWIERVKAAVKACQDGETEAADRSEPAGFTPTIVAAAKSEEAPSGKGESQSKSNSGVVKVDTGKLDSLMDLVGEMVVAQSQVAQNVDSVATQNQQLMRNLAQLRRITNELQRTAMSLRMVPIRGTFQKMTRLVRDLSTKAGKMVELQISGADTELDRSIIEEINSPLVHMIRNAVDHGLETPEARTAKGKPAKGTIWLRAFHQGGNVVIEIADDGAGLDRQRILSKGIERGLVQEGQQLAERDIFGLIFQPGFSTAQQVTEISGRGVGMDVVRRNINRLHGKIEIESEQGKGSTFSIFLPLTLAIIDGLAVSVGQERFLLPTLSVRESFRPTADMLNSIHERAETVNVRGQILPLLRLHDHFSIEPESRDPLKSIIVVVEAEGRDHCLMVDRLLGKQEIVIKGLGPTFQENRYLAGAAILGDGRVSLILDVNSLVSNTALQALAG